jgi:hypothetical protein
MKKNHKKLLILLFLWIGLTQVQAQQAVITTGGNATGSGGSASYTVGQIAYSTATGSNGVETQGVQQPYELFIVGLDENPGIDLQLTVYPNPTPAEVTLNIGSLDPKTLEYRLFDANGKILKTQIIQRELTVVPMVNLPAGNYILKVLRGKSELRTFKIIKK